VQSLAGGGVTTSTVTIADRVRQDSGFLNLHGGPASKRGLRRFCPRMVVSDLTRVAPAFRRAPAQFQCARLKATSTKSAPQSVNNFAIRLKSLRCPRLYFPP
jgi:hypothetical protein